MWRNEQMRTAESEFDQDCSDQKHIHSYSYLDEDAAYEEWCCKEELYIDRTAGIS